MTLTAIALLFSILNIRTVPFCILDEVEAALGIMLLSHTVEENDIPQIGECLRNAAHNASQGLGDNTP